MDTTRTLLTQWGLADYASIFEEHEVTPDLFKYLTNELLERLIPKIGKMIVFKNKLQMWQAEVVDEPNINKNTVDSAEVSNPKSPVSTSSVLSEYSAPSTSARSLFKEEVEMQIEDVTSLAAISNLDTTDQNSDIDKQILLIDVEDNPSNQSYKRSRESTTSSISKLLNSSNSGRSLLKVYDTTGLQQAHRQVLADILIRNELEENPDTRISCGRLEELAEKIVEVFPRELKSTYFARTNLMQNGRKLRTGRGKLFTKYYSLRRSYIKSGLIDTKKEADNASFDGDAADFQEDAAPEVIEWLQHYAEPWTIVELHWSKTTRTRHKELLQNKAIFEYFNTFPALKAHNGYLLIDIDFQNLYPAHTNKLYDNWDTISRSVTRVCIERLALNRDLRLREMIKALQDPNTTRASLINNLMVCTCYLLPAVSIVNNAKVRCRPSKSDIQEGFWLHVKTISEMHTIIGDRKSKQHNYGFTLKPLVIVVGASLSEIHAYYVNIEDHMYEIESPLKALDICFKSYHALNLSYSTVAEQVWYFIQQAYYSLRTKWDKSFTGVNVLLSEINVYS